MSKIVIIDDKIVNEINTLSHYAMAKLWRFAPFGHIYFDPKLPYYKIFKNRFQELGGMTSKISKKIGWDPI